MLKMHSREQSMNERMRWSSHCRWQPVYSPAATILYCQNHVATRKLPLPCFKIWQWNNIITSLLSTNSLSELTKSVWWFLREFISSLSLSKIWYVKERATVWIVSGISSIDIRICRRYTDSLMIWVLYVKTLWLTSVTPSFVLYCK